MGVWVVESEEVHGEGEGGLGLVTEVVLMAGQLPSG